MPNDRIMDRLATDVQSGRPGAKQEFRRMREIERNINGFDPMYPTQENTNLGRMHRDLLEKSYGRSTTD